MKSYIVSAILCLSSFVSYSQFITTWNVGNDLTITIPTFPGETYDYSVDWENDGVIDDTNITGDISHTYPNGTTEVTVSITATFPRIYINNNNSIRFEIYSVDQWGSNPWTSMGSSFRGCTNLQILATDEPDLSAVTDCSLMFRGANNVGDDLNDWDVSNVEDFSFMFQFNQFFNGNISNWDMGSAIDLTQMFDKAFLFNQDISGWDVANVTSMFGMLFQCPINQNLGGWDISSEPDMTSMLNFGNMSIKNYDLTLQGWESQNVADITLGATGMNYCNSKYERDELESNGWTITGDTESCGTNDFITTWNTTNTGGSNNDQITIPIFPSATYSYDVDWDNDGIYDEYGITGSITHTFNTSGVKTIRIKGEFPRIYFDAAVDKNKLVSVDQWGCISWTSMSSAFFNCDNFNVLATDAPDLSNVLSLHSMFNNCALVNADLNHWDVSNITSFANTFRTTAVFNGNISSWDMANANTTALMFDSATSFNQDIGGWDVSGVSNFIRMFDDASAMDQNLGNWDISGSTILTGMLDNTGFSVSNYDKILIGWDNLGATGVSLGAAGGLQWCNADDARTNLIDNKGWTISGDSKYCIGDVSTDPITLDVNRVCNFETFSYIGHTDSEYTPAPICGSGTEDIWFTCTVPASSLIIFDFEILDDHVVSIYKNSATGPLVECHELGPNDMIKLEEDKVDAGDNLFIQVYRTSTENEMEICAYDPQLNCTTALYPAEEQFATPINLNWTFSDTIAADSYNVYLGGNETPGFIGNIAATQFAIPVDSTKDERLMYWRAVPVRNGIESNDCANSNYFNTATSTGSIVCSKAVYLKLDDATCNYYIEPLDVSNQAAVIVISGIPEAAITGNGTASLIISADEIPQSFANPLIIDSYITSATTGRGCITEGYLSTSINCGVVGYDNDGDGIPYIDDNCPETTNADQLDTDGDGVGDVCDNCIAVSNSSQSDYDENGVGDACDTVGNLQTDNNVGIGIADPNFKLEVDGSLFINAEPSNGAIIMKSEDGSCWRMIATDEGTLNLVKTDCGN